MVVARRTINRREDAVEKFISRHEARISCTLSGFDRLVLRGSLLPLMAENGMFNFLWRAGVRLLDFKDYVTATSERVKGAAINEAQQLARPIEYLESPKTSKEDLARKLLDQHPLDGPGLVCLFKAVEPCRTFEYHRSKDPKERGLKLKNGKCLHLYKYFVHPQFGFMNARIQTWFPFSVQVCLNGREWLAQQLAKKFSAFRRVDNCFTALGNPRQAQRLMHAQLRTSWPRALDAIANVLNPLHDDIFEASPMTYYWTAYQTEWATDVLFKSPAALAAVYPALVQHAMRHFKSPDVMRFLGKKISGNFLGEIITSFKDRPEGVRVKHWSRGNSIKMYDKAASVLRVETTIGRTSDFKVLRPPHDNPDGELAWRPMRKGVADLHRRTKLSQAANERYLDALSVIDDSTPCSRLFDAVARPVVDEGRRFRALRIGDPLDLELLEIIARGEFTTAGFRNRDIRRLLHRGSDALPAEERHRLAARVSRLLRLLRAHGLIKKVQKSHRYQLSDRGRLLTAAVRATRDANVRQLLAAAA